MAAAVSQVRMGDENVRNLHAFFTPRSGKNMCNIPIGLLDLMCLGLDEISSEPQDRRKRRRTAPRAQLSSTTHNHEQPGLGEWETQLRVAAYGASLGSTPATVAIGQNDQKLGCVTDCLSVNREQDCHLIEEPLPAGDTKSRIEESVYHSDTSITSQPTLTHPKKMLIIRPDGKLASPKARSTSTDRKPKKKRALSKLQDTSKKRVAIIKYGLNDELRILIGQKIEKICSDLIKLPDSNLGEDDKISQPIRLPKTTHPFFLAASARTLDQTANLKEASAESKIQDQQHPGLSSKNQQSPRKPILKPSAWIGLIGSSCSVNNSRAPRFSGAVEPPWPPQGMMHVRPQIDSSSSSLRDTLESSQIRRGCRKLKYANMQIPEYKNILRPYNDLANIEKCKMQKADNQRNATFWRPQRRILKGSELQSRICNIISLTFPHSISFEQIESFHGTASKPQPFFTHNALSNVFNDIPNSLTAFDKFECETQDWVHKYAPKRAEEVLQHGREAMVLRNWLKSLAVSSVENGSSQIPKKRDTPRAFKAPEGRSKRKKRKKAEELGGFVISDGEESDQMDELANPDILEIDSYDSRSPKKSVIRSGDVLGQSNAERAANAIVISGPHGCGKTAAVYAVASELNFEVFEINAGSKRSGKDILDKVGDMTRNHLVNHTQGMKEIDSSEESAPLVGNSSELGQDSINSFFQPQLEIKRKAKGRPKKQGNLSKTEEVPRKAKSQKQSVILLEEVDVLFEEDRQFWATTLDLITHSKRPIIMTCNDENLLPLNEMDLFAILRFAQPPEQLAVDYLLLVACNEGHLLSRRSISTLLRSRSYDLRASITDLNFFCQMAIGDTKGGLEWMLIDSPHKSQDQNRKKRVVSENTYLEGMGFPSIAQCKSGWETFNHPSHCEGNKPCSLTPSRRDLWKTLEDLEKGLDAISAADIHPCSTSRHGNSVSILSLSTCESLNGK